MEDLKSGLSGQSYRVIQPLPAFGEGLYRGNNGSHDVTLRIIPNEPERVRLLRAEAELFDRLSHPQIVSLLDRGRNQRYYFLAFDTLAERPLEELLNQTTLSLTAALDLSVQILELLSALHVQGLAWGRLRPQAFWIDRSGHLKLFDLAGANQQLGTHQPTLSEAIYLAPEVSSSQKPVSQSDLYSFGVLAYELLTGHPPFTGSSPTELTVKHLTEPPPDPQRMRSDLPAELASIITGCLNKNPKERPPSAEAILTEIEAIRVRLAAEEQARTVSCPRCYKQVPAGERCPLCQAKLVVAPPPAPRRRRNILAISAIIGAVLAIVWMLLGTNASAETGVKPTPIPSQTVVLTPAQLLPTVIPTLAPTATAVPMAEGMLRLAADDVADPNVDLIEAGAWREKEEILARFHVVGRINETGKQSVFQLFFDTGTPEGNSSLPWKNFSADYMLSYRSAEEYGMVMRWNGDTWQGIGAASVEVTGGTLTVHIPATWLDEASSLQYAMLAMNPGENLVDYAPTRNEAAAIIKD